MTRPEHQRTSSQTSHSTPSQHRRSLSASEPSPSSPTMGDDDEDGEEESPTAKVKPKKRLSGVGKVFGFGKLNYAMKGIIDVDPETTRRNNIGKTKEAIAQVHPPRARPTQTPIYHPTTRTALELLRSISWEPVSVVMPDVV